MESLGRILKAPRGQTQGQKPEGPQAPRVFGRGSGRGGPSIYSRGTPLSTRGTSRGAPFTIIPPRLFHRLSFFLDPEEIKSNKTNKRTTLKRLPMVAPRVSTKLVWTDITLSIFKEIPVIPPLDYPYERPVKRNFQKSFVFLCL